jgi:hypothetical protein
MDEQPGRMAPTSSLRRALFRRHDCRFRLSVSTGAETLN